MIRESWHGKGIEPHIVAGPGKQREIVAAMLRRPILDLNDQALRDPVLLRALRLMRRPGEWARLVKIYQPEKK